MPLTDEGLMHVPGMHSRWVRLASGAKAHYMTSGESGPAVILLHGGIIGSSGMAGWRLNAPVLGANGFRVYCPDMPGFGLSDMNEEHWPNGFASHVDFIHEFATALCLDRFHIAGNSLGCFNTVSYVVAHPERVISYALIAGSVGDLVPLDPDATRAAAPKATFDGTEEWMRKSMGTIVHREDAVTDDLVAMRTLTANRTRAAYEHWLEVSGRLFFAPDENPNLVARFRTADRFDRMTIPGIYIWGASDVLNPVEQAHPQEDALPRVQFFYPTETGHQAQTDDPDLVNQLFLEFFGTGKVTWETALRAGISTRRPPIADRVAMPADADAVR